MTATILVVEDNPITRKLVRVTLNSEGYRVLEAADGRSAVALMTRHIPHLVLQDKQGRTRLHLLLDEDGNAAIQLLLVGFVVGLRWWTPQRTAFMVENDGPTVYQYVSLDHVSRYTEDNVTRLFGI